MPGNLLQSLTFTAALLAATSAFAADPPPRPNVIVILADDMGFSDIGCYGSEIPTPNIDRLASTGIKFKQFYNTARCCPTRACLLTGLYQHSAGVGHMVGTKTPERPPGYTNQLSDSCVTIAEALQPAGYTSGLSGKWHVGPLRPHWPVDRGFDYSFSIIQGPFNYFGHTFHLEGAPKPIGIMALNDQPYTPPIENFYATDAFGEHAVKFVRDASARKQPFFLYLPFTSPHWPLHAKADDIKKHEGKYDLGWDRLREQRHKKQIELGIVEASWKLTPRDAEVPAWDSLSRDQQKQWSHRMAVYAAQIDSMDQNIGRLMETLKTTGTENNTLVMFLADNGGCAEVVNRGRKSAPAGSRESFMSYEKGWANASNTPFRLHKSQVHEGGIATPFIASWPGVISQGAISNQPAHVIDIMPTILEAARAAYPKEHKGKSIKPVEGKSLVSILKGNEAPVHDMLFFEHQGNRAVRHGNLKLVARHASEWELYDLEKDRTELNNLARERPEEVARLKRTWQDWASKAGVRPWPLAKQSP